MILFFCHKQAPHLAPRHIAVDCDQLLPSILSADMKQREQKKQTARATLASETARPMRRATKSSKVDVSDAICFVLSNE